VPEGWKEVGGERRRNSGLCAYHNLPNSMKRHKPPAFE
jgi:hypothetical protein